MFIVAPDDVDARRGLLAPGLPNLSTFIQDRRFTDPVHQAVSNMRRWVSSRHGMANSCEGLAKRNQVLIACFTTLGQVPFELGGRSLVQQARSMQRKSVEQLFRRRMAHALAHMYVQS
jgi:hypothetical protein